MRREVVHAVGDSRWARRPPQAAAFRGEGDDEGGVEGGGGGGDGDGDVGRRGGIRIAGDSGGDDRHWDAAERESARRTRTDCTVSQAMVGQRIGVAGSSGRLAGGGERCGQRKGGGPANGICAQRGETRCRVP